MQYDTLFKALLSRAETEELELSPKQLSALEHLMMGKNIQVSAAATGVDFRTQIERLKQEADDRNEEVTVNYVNYDTVNR